MLLTNKTQPPEQNNPDNANEKRMLVYGETESQLETELDNAVGRQ